MEDFSGWDRYNIIEKIGEGGMGKVYKAFDPHLKRFVALKFVKEDSDNVIKRFIQEAQAQGQITHENICRIYEVGEYNNMPYIAMQYIDGPSLFEIENRINLEQKVLIMKAVAGAIHEAHRKGIIHRDIKPSNIMLEQSPEGEWIPYVMDFGLAREIESPSMTMSGMVVGTPNYMSPEQARGDRKIINRRSDIYCIGSTMYELFTGERAFTGDSPLKVLLKVVNDDPEPIRKINPGIPVDLENIVMKCLEKEPHRRYDSAKAIAEDLQFYLDGEPVLARSSTITYKILKKVKKHKIAVTLGSIVFIILIILISMQLHARWKMGKIADIAQKFGQNVVNIESSMRISHTIPLHDIRPEEKRVRSQIEEIRNQTKQVGDLGIGPGNYALGRGYIVLSEYDNALKYLKRSWDSGYKTQKVAYAMGLTLTKIYKKEYGKIEKISEKSLKGYQKKKIEEKYLKPAIEFLKKSRGLIGESPEYLEALIAYNDRQFNVAIKKARSAFYSIPWLYEAKFLEGYSYQTMGVDKKDKGDISGALHDFKKAEEAFKEAIHIGESDPQSYNNLCNLWTNVIDILLYEKGEDITPYIEKALLIVQKSMIADSDLAETYEIKANIYGSLGEYKLENGQDPKADFLKAIENAQKASKIDPNNGLTLLNKGNSYLYLGYYEMMQGKNPSSFLKEAMRNYRKAIQIDPDNAKYYSSLGVVYAYTVQYEMSKGIDSMNSINKAKESFRKAIELYPDFYYAYSNLGGIYHFKSMYEESHGKDPLDSINKAIKSYRKAISINPIAYAYRNLGLSLIALSEYEGSHGKDPNNSLNKALEAYKKLIEKKPNNAFAYSGISGVYFNKGYVLLDEGKDPKHAFNQSIKYCEKSIKLNPKLITPYSSLATSYIGFAEYRYLIGKSPFNMIKKAEENLKKAAKINPNDSDVYLLWIESLILKSRYELDHDRSPIVFLNVCKSLYKKVANIDQILDIAHQQAGVIACMEARWKIKCKKNPEKSFVISKNYFKKAIKINPLNAMNYYKYSEFLFWQSKWQIKLKKRSEHIILDGIKYADKAISINPRMAKAFAVKGMLYHLQSKIEKDIKQKKRLIDQGNFTIEKALEINGNLRYKYKKKIKNM